MGMKRNGTFALDEPACSRAAAAARWSDPKVAAEALLSGTVPFLVDSVTPCASRLGTPRPSVGNPLESAVAVGQSAAAFRWNDPKVAAQALLDRSRFFVPDPLERLPYQPMPVSDTNRGGVADLLEGDPLDPAEHPRGPDGRFIDAAGGGQNVRSPEELNDLYDDYKHAAFKSRDAAAFIASAKGKAEFGRNFGADAAAAAAYQQLRNWALQSIDEFDRQAREDKRAERDKAAARQRRDDTQPLASQPNITETERKLALARAHLAAAAYGGGNPGPGWKSVKVWEPRPGNDIDIPPGFRAELFQDEKTGQYVLAFAGTNDLADAATDIGQGLAFKTKQYDYAMKLADDVAKQFAKKGGAKLEFVGHSLGGGLATAAAAITGAKATTFNPAGVAPETVARVKNTAGKPGSLADIKPSQVTAYRIAGDVLTTTQDALPGMPDKVGRKVTLHVDPSLTDVKGATTGATIGAKLIKHPAGAAVGAVAGVGVNRHLMDNFFRALAPSKQ